MKYINDFLKLFDRELFQVMLIMSGSIALLLVNLFEFQSVAAIIYAPLISLGIFLGLVGSANLISLMINLMQRAAVALGLKKSVF